MPLHIKDEDATAAVRELARVRNTTLTDAVRTACQEALARDQGARPVRERLAAVHARVRAAGHTGKRADKEFFDREWGDRR